MRLFKRIAIACVALLLAGVATVYGLLRASLPVLDGNRNESALVADISIERDALGTPTVEADTRADLAFGTGFVHGQDRFFQMDLSRRLAAGELTPLFGAVAAAQDAKARVFHFRRVALRVVQQATPEQRALLTAYTRGVNAGLASLRSRPWEYWLLRSRPVEWRAEDTILVVHAMWWDLQYAGFRREKLRRQIDARVGGPVLGFGWKHATCFLYPPDTEWDAPNVSGDDKWPDELKSCAEVPTSGELDLSRFRAPIPSPAKRGRVGEEANPVAGSNNWAVAGAHTANGGALIANDMHLNLRVPATWYRARLRLRAKNSIDALDLNGLTLPGGPVLVAGSNGHVAWGFTNSYGNWLDEDAQGALHWLAAVPEATNLRLLDLEKARSVAAVLRLAPQIGIPHQNLIVGDRAGHIAWTLIGRIPRSTGAERNVGTSGWLAFEDAPRVVDPSLGLLWTANARATDNWGQLQSIGGTQAALGAQYDLGARAQQIREDLLALKHPATPADMLAIQLDDRARFLKRWRDLLIDLLDADALRGHAPRAEFKQQLQSWNGRASVDSVAYGLVREYRSLTERAVWQSILGALALEPTDAPPPAQFEAPLWTLVTVQPEHLLARNYASWREFLLSQVDTAITQTVTQCGRLADCTWGRRKPAPIRHPLSAALPQVSRWLDMPAVELPGDRNMPRVQEGAFGASERFAVTPGLESQGYLHIAGGQSGHPLSPYYRAGFKEWAQGTPLPFLPGPVQHRLTLRAR